MKGHECPCWPCVCLCPSVSVSVCLSLSVPVHVCLLRLSLSVSVNRCAGKGSIVQVRVQMCCLNAVKHIFHIIFNADHENSGCSTTLLSMQSCCAINIFILYNENHIKIMFFYLQTTHRDTYLYNYDVETAHRDIIGTPTCTTKNVPIRGVCSPSTYELKTLGPTPKKRLWASPHVFVGKPSGTSYPLGLLS